MLDYILAKKYINQYGGSSITSNLKGKFWITLGDSITEQNLTSTKKYHDYIKEWSECIIGNYAVTATGWFVGGANAIHDKISTLPDADIVTVFAGTNDYGEGGVGMALGALGDTDPAASLYGAITNTITQLIAKYPTKIIAVFTPVPRSANWTANAGGITLQQVVDAIIAVCNYYSIPVLDLWRNSSLYPWNATNNTMYFSWSGSPGGDGLHLNKAGQLRIAYQIYDFLNNLVGTSLNPSSVATPSPNAVDDTFTRANSTITLGSADTGQSWDVLSGTWGITGNKAYALQPIDSIAVIDTGAANVAVSANIEGSISCVVARCSDFHNFILAYIVTASTDVNLYKRVAGSYASIGTYHMSSFTPGCKLELQCNGASLKVLVDDVELISATDAFNQTATKCGIRTANSTFGGRWDNFKVELL